MRQKDLLSKAHGFIIEDAMLHRQRPKKMPSHTDPISPLNNCTIRNYYLEDMDTLDEVAKPPYCKYMVGQRI